MEPLLFIWFPFCPLAARTVPPAAASLPIGPSGSRRASGLLAAHGTESGTERPASGPFGTTPASCATRVCPRKLFANGSVLPARPSATSLRARPHRHVSTGLALWAKHPLAWCSGRGHPDARALSKAVPTPPPQKKVLLTKRPQNNV